MHLLFLLLASLAAVVSSTAIPRLTSKCYTVHKGYLATYPGENGTKWVRVGLNKKKQVTYRAGDPPFQVEFQSCPKLIGQDPRIDDYYGRIIVSGSHNCVTVTNPNGPEGGPFFLGVEKCGSDTNPSASQQWEWGDDFGPVVFWRGKSKLEEIGYTIDDHSNPVVESGTRRIELGCAQSCASFGIRPKKDFQ